MTYRICVSRDNNLALACGCDSAQGEAFTTAAEFFAFVRQLVDAGNKHFGTRALLLPNAAPLTWDEFEAANKKALDEIAKALGIEAE